MLSVGQIVLFTEPYGGEAIPAIVTKAFPDGSANLRVFPDNDFGGMHFFAQVKFDDKGGKGTYQPLPDAAPEPPPSDLPAKPVKEVA